LGGGKGNQIKEEKGNERGKGHWGGLLYDEIIKTNKN